DSKDSVSISADTDLSTKSSRGPQPPSLGPLKSQYPPKDTSTHPNTTQATLSYAAGRLFIISFLICLFAFLLYILSSSPNIFSFCK
ncbi:hypothetical protein B9Z19DRAFT_896528, partial [Tuber borchii]